jgi:hypothetical protein
MQQENIIGNAFMQAEGAISICAMLGGDTGAGKTTLACTLPKLHFCGYDNNISNAILHYKRTGFTPDLVSGTRPGFDNDWKPLKEPEEPLDYFSRANQALMDAVQNPEVRSIVIDGLSPWSDYQIKAIHNRIVSSTSKSDYSYTLYRNFKNEFIQFINYLASANKNIVLLCHWETAKDPDSGFTKYFPVTEGSMQFRVANYFSSTWNLHFDADTKERKLQLLKDNKFTQLKGSIEDEYLTIPRDPLEIRALLTEKFGF